MYTYHDQNLKPIPSPAPSDAFSLSCNVAFIVGFAILTQSSFGRVHASVRLDGAIAGLAIAAVAGVVWFEPVLHLSGRPFQAAVDLAYPVCALVLIVLLVAGLAPHRFRPNWTTDLAHDGRRVVRGRQRDLSQPERRRHLPGGDTARRDLAHELLLHRPGGDAARPAALGALSCVGQFAGGHRRGARGVRGGLPGGAGSPPSTVTTPRWWSILAIAALGLVICRMAVTLREVRQSTANYQDARTDYLTGLPNRRAFLERLESTFVLRAGRRRSTPACCWSTSTVSRKSTMLWATPPATSSYACVAKRFEHRLGNRGVLARLGGDEYACALPRDRRRGPGGHRPRARRRPCPTRACSTA